MKKKISKFGKFIFQIKTKIKNSYKKTDKRLVFVFIALLLFILSYQVGSVATQWRMEKKYSSDEAVLKNAAAANEKNNSRYFSKKKDSFGKEINTKNDQNPTVANMFGYGYEGQKMRDNIFVVLAIKMSLLAILLAVLFIGLARMIKRHRIRRKYAIRQTTKSIRKAVKIKKVTARKRRR